MLPVDRIGCPDNRDGAQLVDATARLLDCHPDIVHRDLAGKPEPIRIVLAVVVRPIVVSTCECRRVVGCDVVVHQNLPSAGAVHHSYVDPFYIHRSQRRGRVEATLTRQLEMWNAVAASPLEVSRLPDRCRRTGKQRNDMAQHLHTENRISVGLVLFFWSQGFLLPPEEPWWLRPIGLVEISLP